MTTTLARAIEGIPVVGSATERDALFAPPATDQRVQLRTTGEIQRYSGVAWVLDVPGTGGSVFDVRRYGAVGDGITNDRAAIQAAIDAASASGANGGTVVFPGGYGFWNLGSGAGLTVPRYVNLVSMHGVAQFYYGGSGIAIDCIGAAYFALRNLYVILSDPAGKGYRFGGSTGLPARWIRLTNVTAHCQAGTGNTGTGFVFDSGPTFSAYLSGRQVYSIGFKIGVDVIGQSVGANTWTTVNIDQLVISGPTKAAGSIAIRTDANTNLEASTLTNLIVENFESPFSFANAAGCIGFNMPGAGIENNTNLPVFPLCYSASYDDNHANLSVAKRMNGVSFGWWKDVRQLGYWQTESRYDRLHEIGQGSGTRQRFGLVRGDSAIDAASTGGYTEDKFVVECGGYTDYDPGRNNFKLTDWKQSWATAVPSTGSWGIDSIVHARNPTAGKPLRWRCTASGTYKAALAITGTSALLSPNLTVSAISTIEVNDYVTHPGWTGPQCVRQIIGNVLVFQTNATAASAGTAVQYTTPTWEVEAYKPGTATIAVDANATYTWTIGTDAPTQRLNVPITALRTVTLATAGAKNGDRIRFTRSAAATGAFNWDIGGLKSLTPGTWCEVEFDGAAWFEQEAGTL